MKIRCKSCKSILVDTETGVSNYVVEYDIDIVATLEGQKLELVRFGVCVNCGHRFDIGKLEEVLWKEKIFDS